jgi:hypothetical protein
MRPILLAAMVGLLACACGSDDGDDDGSASHGSASGGEPFACGAQIQCKGSQYCEVHLDPNDVPTAYRCVALPDTCGDSASCDCLEEVPCGDDCEALAEGGLKTSCSSP